MGLCDTPKLISKQSEKVAILIYLLGEYGVPTTEYGMNLLINNIGNLLLNGTFGIDNIPSELTKGLPDSIKNTGGVEFYKDIIDISQSGKLNSNTYKEELLTFFEAELKKITSLSEANLGNEIKELNDIAMAQFDEDSQLEKAIEESEDEKGMNLDKADTLTLTLELLNRATNAAKLKTLDINLTQSTIDSLAKAIVNCSNESAVDLDEKHQWSSSARVVPTPKTLYGIDINVAKAILDIKKAMIIEGVPGTGKSQLMFSLLNKLTEGNPDRFKVISFNQTTSYSEFIEGLRQVDGVWKYVDGTFLSFCKIADADRSNRYYFAIDEISRGDTESIFGELLTAIECRDTIITLQSGNTIVVPSNLYIIGTMNTLDRSSKFIDRATADRFTHLRLEPQWTPDYISGLDIDKSLSDYDKNTLSAALELLCGTMREVNETLCKENSNGYDNVIGTRAISIPNLTVEKLRSAIRHLIVPELQNKRNMCSMATLDKLSSSIDSLLSI